MNLFLTYVFPGMNSINILNQDKYKDIALFLVLIPVINALNYYLTYSHIRFNWFTLLTFSIDTLVGYAAWLGIRAVILFLDKKIPYSDLPHKRILIQLLSTTVMALLIIILLTELENAIARDKPVPESFYEFDIFIFISWFFVINGIYIGLHYFGELRHSETKRDEEKKLRKEGFVVKQGKQNLSLPFADIRSMYVEGEYVILLTANSKKYFLDQSLDKIEQSLPSEWFFRLNRQFILHRQSISGFKRLDNGKLDVMLYPADHLPDAIPVSRTRAAAFKTWFQS
jgi:DNA-binding LytR/AlgR family response regulator